MAGLNIDIFVNHMIVMKLSRTCRIVNMRNQMYPWYYALLQNNIVHVYNIMGMLYVYCFVFTCEILNKKDWNRIFLVKYTPIVFI